MNLIQIMLAQGSVYINFLRTYDLGRFFYGVEVSDLKRNMKLNVNGEVHDHQGDGSIKSLLNELGAHPEQTALMIDGIVIPSTEWENTQLTENSEIELLVFVGGG